MKFELGRNNGGGRGHPCWNKEDWKLMYFHSGDAGAKAKQARFVDIMAVPSGHRQPGDRDKEQYYRGFAQEVFQVALPHRGFAVSGWSGQNLLVPSLVITATWEADSTHQLVQVKVTLSSLSRH